MIEAIPLIIEGGERLIRAWHEHEMGVQWFNLTVVPFAIATFILTVLGGLIAIWRFCVHCGWID